MIIQNKHIIRLSFIGLFFTIIAHIILYRYFMIKNIVLEEVAAANSHIAEIYYDQIWGKHDSITSKLSDQDYKTLLSDQGFIDFASDSIKFFENVSLASITLYDTSGDQFLASNELGFDVDNTLFEDTYDKISYNVDAFFLRDVMAKDGLDQAFSGSSNHAI